MSEAIFEFKSKTNMVFQLLKNGFDLIRFTNEMTTMGRSFSETYRLLLVLWYIDRDTFDRDQTTAGLGATLVASSPSTESSLAPLRTSGQC